MLHYDEYGSRDNPTILMLHGAGTLDTFCQQYSFSEKYHLVVPHLPGAGKSVGEVYEPEKTAQELYDLIADLGKEKIGVIGHSLGGQIAVKLVSERQELFNFAVFLSAWVNPRPETVRLYCRFTRLMAVMIHWKWMVTLSCKSWNFTPEQTNRMIEYAKLITPQVYRSFFAETLDLAKLPAYQSVNIPMLAICGTKEVKDMKTSLGLLSENPSCATAMVEGANHYFPMCKAQELNSLLEEFCSKHA